MLTAQRDHFEYFPSWSRDGKSIVYTTFDDDMYGSVRIARRAPPAAARAGRSRPSRVTISSRSSLPTASRSSTARGRATTCAGRPGAAMPGSTSCRPPAASRRSSPTTARCRSSAPRATASISMRLRRRGQALAGLARRSTAPICAPTRPPRPRPSSGSPRTAGGSPSRERWNVFVTPFVPTGKAVEVGPKASAVPVARVSKDAGEGLHWSGDCAQPPLVAGAGALLARPQGGLRLRGRRAGEAPGAAGRRRATSASTSPTPKPAGRLALVGARIVTMRRDEGCDEVIEDGVVVVDGNRIVAVGPRAGAGAPVVAAGDDGHRRRRQDDHPRPRRRPLARFARAATG